MKKWSDGLRGLSFDKQIKAYNNRLIAELETILADGCPNRINITGLDNAQFARFIRANCRASRATKK